MVTASFPELAPGDPPYSMVRADDALVVYGGGRTYAIDLGLESPPRDLGASWYFVPSARADRVWLMTLDPESPDTIRDLAAVREVSLDGRVARREGPERIAPEWWRPPAAWRERDYYRIEEEAAMDYAAAVNEEIRDLFAAGADIVQVDEPYLQARPEKARRYGLRALNRALDGIRGATAVHICFGYAAIIHQRPSGYSFLPELAGCSCHQVSIETAQSGLDCSVLTTLEGKHIMLGCLDLNEPAVESRETIVGRVKRALPYVGAERLILAPDCGMKYLSRDVAFGKMRSMVEAAAMLRAELSG